jgi:hypothetical protein
LGHLDRSAPFVDADLEEPGLMQAERSSAAADTGARDDMLCVKRDDSAAGAR